MPAYWSGSWPLFQNPTENIKFHLGTDHPIPQSDQGGKARHRAGEESCEIDGAVDLHTPCNHRRDWYQDEGDLMIGPETLPVLGHRAGMRLEII